MSLEKRFRRKVASHKTKAGCLEWQAATNGRYGIIRSSSKRHEWLLAHRVSYELNVGPIPKGMDVLHSCDNPKCVNPEHLSVGSPKENSADMVKKDRQKRSAFSYSDAAQMRYMSATVGMTQSEIAGYYGVSRPLISMLLNGKIARLSQ